ncbi:hypothetical protein [Sporosarcina sp. YIM B06819]|uniref:hypothetical protein n=1 Tax=Sporosarcina sp. YIM B06819 TaxID=3081769 RepID=UPI00298D4EB8|nr:hypothetical protein [Sporosarcina sp. YIM B06819]
MTGSKEPDELSEEFLKSLQDDDPFGLNEEMETVLFECADCRKEDDVPDFVVQDFQVYLKKNEEVEIECPFCGGTIRRAKKSPK